MFRRKAASVVSAVLVVSASAVTSADHVPTAAATSTFTPTADTYVDSTFPGTNYGSSGQLGVDNSPVKRSFLKFDVTGLSGTVATAALRIHTDDVPGAESGSGGSFRAMSNTTWSETAVTYNNQPAIDGTTLGSLGAVARNTWYQVDVTALVTGNGTVSIAITLGSSDGADYDSRETGATAPQLVVSTGEVPPPPPPPPTTSTFTPAADAVVNSASAGTNYGSSGQLGVDNSPVKRSFLKFDVTGLSGTMATAALRIHTDDVAGSQSNNGGSFRATSNTSWSETTVTYNNQPAIDGTTLGSLGAVARNTWYQVDVTALVTGNGTVSIAITSTSSNGADYDSRETGATAPQLVVSTGDTPPPPPGDPVLVGAGDIAGSGSGDEATAALLDGIPGTVFTAGDNAYPDGTTANFADYYEPTWGRHKARTRPSPGNHDYNTSGAAPYYGYFGAGAGASGQGYYSYDLGNWHVVSLNSNVSAAAGSAQEQWLRADLAASAKPCTVAYWHHPRFSSGTHGSSTAMADVVQGLYDFDADVIVAGHDHLYERFAPMNPSGQVDSTSGIRHFVAGMGGRSLYSFGTILPTSQARYNGGYGVLKLTLHDNSYTWQFVPAAGTTYADTGTTNCH